MKTPFKKNPFLGLTVLFLLFALGSHAAPSFVAYSGADKSVSMVNSLEISQVTAMLLISPNILSLKGIFPGLETALNDAALYCGVSSWVVIGLTATAVVNIVVTILLSVKIHSTRMTHLVHKIFTF